jgi:hypothetical protein
MKKYEKKVVKQIYKLLKKDIKEFNFGYYSEFLDLSLFDDGFEHRRIFSKKGEIQINFIIGVIESPINMELKGKYKKKIIPLIEEYYHEKREEFATKKINDCINDKPEISVYHKKIKKRLIN